MRILQAGVYFLFDEGELVYIGKSNNIMSRIGTHIAQGEKKFDSYEVFETEDNSRLEEFLIRLLQPKYNRSVPGTEFEHMGEIQKGRRLVQFCHDGVVEDIPYEEYKKKMMMRVI